MKTIADINLQSDLARSLLAAESRLHEVATACATAEQQRDELAAQVEVMREAILQFRNEPVLEFAHAIRATHGYVAMERASLHMPSTAAAIPRQRDARTLQGAIDRMPFGSIACCAVLRSMIDELERENG